MNDFPITYLRRDGQDEPVVAFHDRLLVFELPAGRESFISSKINFAKRFFTGNRLGKLHALSSGVHFNLPRINAYQYCDADLRRYFEEAKSIAVRHSNRYLTSSHLLLALLKETFVQCLFTKRLEIPLTELSHALASNLASAPSGEFIGIDNRLAKIMLKATGVTRSRGAEEAGILDAMAAMIAYDSDIEQILRKYGYSQNDRENLVTWLKLTAGSCSSLKMHKIRLMKRFLMWAGPVDYADAEGVVARDAEIHRVMDEISHGHNLIILEAENGIGADALIGSLSAKYQEASGTPLVELHVSQIARGASASTLEQRFASVFKQLLFLKHPALVIRGFDELLGVAGSTGFDFTAMLSKFAARKKLTLIAVLNSEALYKMKSNPLFNAAKVIKIMPLDQNGRIKVLLSVLAHQEELTGTMVTYGAVKLFVERVNDPRPRLLIDRFKSLVPRNNGSQVELITRARMNDLLTQAGV